MKIIKILSNTLLYVMCIAAVAVMAYGANPAAAFVVSWVVVEAVSLMLPRNVIGIDVYADTVLQAARAFLKGDNNKKFQLRPTFTKIIEAFKRDREFTIPSLSSIRKADTQTTTALYLKKKDFTVGSTKSCAPVGQQSGSAKVDLTWTTKTVILKTNFKQHAGNEVSMARALANDLYNAEQSLWTAVDVDLLAYLEANKSGVNDGASGSFDTVNDIMAITNTNKTFFYNLVTADMQMNDYSPEFFDVHDPMWSAYQRQYINQGAGNSVNTAFQFDGFIFLPSNLIIPGAIGSNTYTSLHYIIPAGGVAIVDWNDPLNRAGKVSGEKVWMTMQSLIHPEFTLDVYKTSDCADTSADGGSTQDFTEVWEISFTYAKAIQPLPVVGETPIFKYGTLSGDSFTS